MESTCLVLYIHNQYNTLNIIILYYTYIYIHHYNIPILPLPLYIDGYSGWTGPQDEGEELEVVFQIPPSTGKKDVKIEFRRQEIRMLKPEVNVWKTKTWGDEIMGYSI